MKSEESSSDSSVSFEGLFGQFTRATSFPLDDLGSVVAASPGSHTSISPLATRASAPSDLTDQKPSQSQLVETLSSLQEEFSITEKIARQSAPHVSKAVKALPPRSRKVAKKPCQVIVISDDSSSGSEDDEDMIVVPPPVKKESQGATTSDASGETLMPEVGSEWPSVESVMLASLKAANHQGHSWKILSKGSRHSKVLGCGKNPANRLTLPICPVRLDIQAVDSRTGAWKVTRSFTEHNHEPASGELKEWKKKSYLMDMYRAEDRARLQKMKYSKTGNRTGAIARKGNLSNQEFSSRFFPPTPSTSSSTSTSSSLNATGTSSSFHHSQFTREPSLTSDSLTLTELDSIVCHLNPILVPLAETLHQQGLRSRQSLLYFFQETGKVMEKAELGSTVLRMTMLWEVERVKRDLGWYSQEVEMLES